MSVLEKWKAEADNIDVSFCNKMHGIKSFFSILKFIHESDWQGACHASSAILYILFKEKGIDAGLYIGECQNGLIAFDHSWVEVEGKVFDAAISNTLALSFSPIYYDIDLNTGDIKSTKYGVVTGQGYDSSARMVKQLTFGDYMSGFPEYKNGLWGMLKDIGGNAGMNLNIARIKQKYHTTEWNEKA
jgi:hypothetical protein